MPRSPLRHETTFHQAVEYLVGLCLAYVALRANSGSSLIMLGVAATLFLVAALSPGGLGWRLVLGVRMHRVADIGLAVGCVALSILVTGSDLFATIPLLAVAAVLVRLGLGRRQTQSGTETQQPSVAAGRDRAGEAMGPLQPVLNRTARAAGIFIRNRRSNRNS
jgi:hypothetical protein